MAQVWTEDPFMFDLLKSTGDAFSPLRKAQLQVQAQALAKGKFDLEQEYEKALANKNLNDAIIKLYGDRYAAPETAPAAPTGATPAAPPAFGAPAPSAAPAGSPAVSNSFARNYFTALAASGQLDKLLPGLAQTRAIANPNVLNDPTAQSQMHLQLEGKLAPPGTYDVNPFKNEAERLKFLQSAEEYLSKGGKIDRNIAMQMMQVDQEHHKPVQIEGQWKLPPSAFPNVRRVTEALRAGGELPTFGATGAPAAAGAPAQPAAAPAQPAQPAPMVPGQVGGQTNQAAAETKRFTDLYRSPEYTKYLSDQDAYGKIQSQISKNTRSGDMAALNAVVALISTNARVTPRGVEGIEASSLPDQVQKMIAHLTSSSTAILDDGQRNELYDTAHDLMTQSKRQADRMLDAQRKLAGNEGLRSENAVPGTEDIPARPQVSTKMPGKKGKRSLIDNVGNSLGLW